MNVILQNDFTDSLRKIVKKIPRPRMILIISAHWLTHGTFVTGMAKPRQIYDFYGFPDELYSIQYHPDGSPGDAKRIGQLGQEFKFRLDHSWGLDHASWSILRHMYPEQDVPVLELSLDYTRNEMDHFKMATKLSELRTHGVLVIGSGNIVHNLRLIDFQDMNSRPYDWALSFDERVKEALQEGHYESVIHYSKFGESARLSVPTNDHYLPLLYVIALQEEGDHLNFFHEGFQNKSISMRCVGFGQDFAPNRV